MATACWQCYWPVAGKSFNEWQKRSCWSCQLNPKTRNYSCSYHACLKTVWGYANMLSKREVFRPGVFLKGWWWADKFGVHLCNLNEIMVCRCMKLWIFIKCKLYKPEGTCFKFPICTQTLQTQFLRSWNLLQNNRKTASMAAYHIFLESILKAIDFIVAHTILMLAV